MGLFFFRKPRCFWLSDIAILILRLQVTDDGQNSLRAKQPREEPQEPDLCSGGIFGENFACRSKKTGPPIGVVFLRAGELFKNHRPLFILLCRRRSEEHTSELQSRSDLVCRLL